MVSRLNTMIKQRDILFRRNVQKSSTDYRGGTFSPSLSSNNMVGKACVQCCADEELHCLRWLIQPAPWWLSPLSDACQWHSISCLHATNTPSSPPYSVCFLCAYSLSSSSLVGFCLSSSSSLWLSCPLALFPSVSTFALPPPVIWFQMALLKTLVLRCSSPTSYPSFSFSIPRPMIR